MKACSPINVKTHAEHGNPTLAARCIMAGGIMVFTKGLGHRVSCCVAVVHGSSGRRRRGGGGGGDGGGGRRLLNF